MWTFTICEVHGQHKQGACYGSTRRLGLHPLRATCADTGEVLHARLRKGSANTARGIGRFVDELVARLRRAGASGELAIRDLKAGAGLAHLPDGWPWVPWFTMALARLRCLPHPI